MAHVQVAPRISVDENVRFGKPVVQGTRVAVSTILGHLAAGDGIDDLARSYGLVREDVLACLAYASQVVSQLRPTPPA